jgi:hypothetical protein
VVRPRQCPCWCSGYCCSYLKLQRAFVVGGRQLGASRFVHLLQQVRRQLILYAPRLAQSDLQPDDDDSVCGACGGGTIDRAGARSLAVLSRCCTSWRVLARCGYRQERCDLYRSAGSPQQQYQRQQQRQGGDVLRPWAPQLKLERDLCAVRAWLGCEHHCQPIARRSRSSSRRIDELRGRLSHGVQSISSGLFRARADCSRVGRRGGDAW